MKADGQCLDLAQLNAFSDKRFELVLAEGKQTTTTQTTVPQPQADTITTETKKTFTHTRMDINALSQAIDDYTSKATVIRKRNEENGVKKVVLKDSLAKADPTLAKNVNLVNNRMQELYDDDLWLLDRNDYFVKGCSDLIVYVEELSSRPVNVENTVAQVVDEERYKALEEELKESEKKWNDKLKSVQREFALELDELKNRLSDRDKLINEKDIVIRDLRANYETSEKECKKAKDILADTRAQIESKYKNFEELNRYITDLFKDKKKMNEIIDEREKKIAQLKMELEDLKAGHNVNDVVEKKFKVEIERLNNLNFGLQARLRDAEAEFKRKEQTWIAKAENASQEKVSSNTTTTTRTITRTTNVKVNKLSKQLQDVESEVQSKDNIIREIRENVQKDGEGTSLHITLNATRDLESQVSMLRLRVLELEKQVEERDAQNNASDNEAVRNLQVIIVRLNSRIKNLENDIELKDRALISSAKGNYGTASIDLHEYNLIITRLQYQISQLQSEIDVKNDLLNARGIEDESDSLDGQAKLRNAENTIATLHSKIRNFEDELEVLRSQNRLLRGSKDNSDDFDMDVIVRRLKIRIQNLEDELNWKDQLLGARPKNTITDASSNSNDEYLKRRLKDLQDELEDRNKLIDKLRQQIRQLEDKVSNNNSKSTVVGHTEVKLASGYSSDDFERLKRKLDDADFEIERKNREIEQLRNQATDTEHNFTKKSNINIQRSEIKVASDNSAEVEKLNHKVRDLKHELENKSETINQLRAQIVIYEEKIGFQDKSGLVNQRKEIKVGDDNSFELDRLKKKLNEVEYDLEDKNREIEHLKKQNKYYEEKFSDKNQLLIQHKEIRVVDELQDEFDRLTKRVRGLEQDINDKNAAIEKLKLKVRIVEAENTKMSQRIDKPADQDSAFVIDRLRRKVQDLEDENEQKDKLIEQSRNKIRSFEDQLEKIAIKEKHNQSSGDGDDSIEVDRLKRRLKDAEYEMEDREKKISQLNHRINDLESELDEKSKAPPQIKEKIVFAEGNSDGEALKKTIKELEDKIEQKDKSIGQLKQQIRDLETEFTTKSRVLDKSRIQDNSSELNNLKKQVKDLQEQKVERDQVIEKLTKADKTSENDSLQKEVKTLRIKVQSLERQLSEKEHLAQSNIRHKSRIESSSIQTRLNEKSKDKAVDSFEVEQLKLRYEEAIDSLTRQLNAQKNVEKMRNTIDASRPPFDENYYVTRVRELEAEIINLKAKIEALGSLNKTNAPVIETREKTTTIITNNNDETAKLRQKISELEMTIASMNVEKINQKDNATENNAEQARKLRITELTEEVERLKVKVKTLTGQLEDQEKMLAERNAEVRRFKMNEEELRDLRIEVESTRRQHKETFRTATDIKEILEAKNQAKQQSIDKSVVANLQNQVTELQKEVKDRDERLVQKQDELRKILVLEKEKEDLAREVAKLKQRINDFQEQEVKRTRMLELQEEKQKADGQSIAEIKKELNQKENEIFDLKSQIRRMAGFEQDLNIANQDIAKLKRVLQETKDTLERAERNQARDQDIQSELELTRKRLDKTKEKSKRRKNEIKQLLQDKERLAETQSELSRIRHKVTEMEVAIESRDNSINILKQKADSGETFHKLVDDQKNQINLLKRMHEEELENSRNLRREVSELRPIAQNYLEAEKQILHLNTELRRLKEVDDELGVTKAEVKKLKQKVTSLEDDVYSKENVIRSFEKNQNNAQAGADSFRQVINQQNIQIQQLNAKIQEDIEVNRQLNKQAIDLKNKNEELYNINVNNNETINKLKEHIRELEVTLSDARNKNEQLLEIISQVQQNYETRIIEITNERNTEYETTIKATYNQLVEYQRQMVLMQQHIEALERDNEAKQNQIITITKEIKEREKEEITKTNDVKTKVTEVVKVKAKEPIADYKRMLESEQNLVRNLKALLEELRNEKIADKLDFLPEAETGKGYAECMLQYLDKGHKYFKDIARVARENAEEASKVEKLEKELKSLRSKPTNLSNLIDTLNDTRHTTENIVDVLRTINGGKPVSSMKYDVTSEDPDLYFDAIHKYFNQHDDFFKQIKDYITQKNKELAALKAFEKDVKSGKNKMASLEDYKNIWGRNRKVNSQLVEVLKQVSSHEFTYKDDEPQESNVPEVILEYINIDFDKGNKFFKQIFSELDDLRQELKRLKEFEQESKGKPKLDDLDGLRKILNDEIDANNLIRGAYRFIRPDYPAMQQPSLGNVTNPLIYIDSINGVNSKTKNLIKELTDAVEKLCNEKAKLQSQLNDLKGQRSAAQYLHDLQTIFNNTDKLNAQLGETYGKLPLVSQVFETTNIKVDSSNPDDYTDAINKYIKKATKNMKDMSDWLDNNGKELQRLRDFERDVRSGNYKMNALDDLREIHKRMRSNLDFEKSILEVVLHSSGIHSKSVIIDYEDKPDDHLAAIFSYFMKWDRTNNELKDKIVALLEELEKLRKFERDVKSGKYMDNCLKEFIKIMDENRLLTDNIRANLERAQSSNDRSNIEANKSSFEIKVNMNSSVSVLEAINKYHDNSLKYNNNLKEEIERMLGELKRLQKFEKDVLSGANKAAALGDFIKIFNSERNNGMLAKDVLETISQRKTAETFNYPTNTNDPHQYLTCIFEIQDQLKRLLDSIRDSGAKLYDELKSLKEERDKLKMERDKYANLAKLREEELEVTVKRLKSAEADSVSAETLRTILSNEIKIRRNLNTILEVVGERVVVDSFNFSLAETDIKVLVSNINSTIDVINRRTEEIQLALGNRKTAVDPSLVLRILEKIEAYKHQFRDYFEIACDEAYPDTSPAPSSVNLSYEKAADYISKDIDFISRMLDDFRESNDTRFRNIVRTLNQVKEEKVKIETLFHDLQIELNKKSGLVGKLQIKLFMATSFLHKLVKERKEAE